MLIPTVVMAMVVGIGVGINTQTRQRDKRQRHKKCQTSCAYSQTDSCQPHGQGPHRTRGVPPSHWVKCPVGRARRTSTPDSGSGSNVLGHRIPNSPNNHQPEAFVVFQPNFYSRLAPVLTGSGHRFGSGPGVVRHQMVEPRGFEPLTFCLPGRRAPSCATAPHRWKK